MLRVSLNRMVGVLESKAGKKLTIAGISQKTGIHRNILSRIINHPEDNSSLRHIEKLMEFFFYELQPITNLSDENLSSFIVANLLEFFPEQAEHKDFINSLQKIGNSIDVPVAMLWEFFRLSRGAPIKADLTAENEWERISNIRRRLEDKEGGAGTTGGDPKKQGRGE